MLRWAILMMMVFLLTWTLMVRAAAPPTPVIYPNEWDGITDNQGHTLTINANGTINTGPTATPT